MTAPHTRESENAVREDEVREALHKAILDLKFDGRTNFSQLMGSEVFWNALIGAVQECAAKTLQRRISTPIPLTPSDGAVSRFITAAKLMLAQCKGCAANHYGHDLELHGLPGWLADCEKDVEAGIAALSTPITPSDEMVEAGARAICEYEDAKWEPAHFGETTNGQEPEEQREGYRLAARACLTAALNLMGGNK